MEMDKLKSKIFVSACRACQVKLESDHVFFSILEP